MQRLRFYFSHAGRNKWVKPRNQILLWLPLVLENDGSRFRKYLASPFLVDPGKKLDVLFTAIAEVYTSPDTEELPVASLLHRLFGSTDYKAYASKVRDHIQLLIDHFANYAALQELSASPIDRANLARRFIHPEAHPELHRSVFQRQSEEAERLPGGTQGAIHRWLVAHHDPGRSEASGQADPGAKHLLASRRLATLTSVVEAMYAVEYAELTSVLDLSVPPTLTHTEGELRDKFLVQLYHGLERLRRLETEIPTAFRAFSRQLFQARELLDREQLVNCYLTLRNYGAFLKKTGKPLPDQLYALWPSFLARAGAYGAYCPLPPLIVLDEFNLLSVYRGPAYAYARLNEMISAVDPAHREWVSLDARIAYHFFMGKYAECRRLANHPDLLIAVSDDWRILIRRHSYKTRSSMEVFLVNRRQQDYMLLQTSIRSFENYLRTMPSSPHDSTVNYVRPFVKILRRMLLLVNPNRERVPSIPALRKLIPRRSGSIHASSWLLNVLDRLEQLEVAGELPFSGLFIPKPGGDE
jgi:hypothetical protein